MRQRRTIVFILALAALIGGLLTGRELLFNLTYLLAFLLILSFAWAWVNIKYVHVSRITRTRRAQVGHPLEERFAIRNTSRIPKLWLEVRDFATLPGHRSSHVVNNLGSQSSFMWRVHTICRERGRYQLGPVRMSTSDPFGLFTMHRDLTQTTNVVIYPMTFDIHQFALPVGILPGGDALRRRTHYVTTNASGVRDYAPGDSFSRIHWRSTARRNRLIVKEFELDPLADIWIVPDMSVFGHVSKSASPKNIAQNEIPIWMQNESFKLPESSEEYTVSVAASLARYFLRRDRSVGMLAYGQTDEILQPDRGERQVNRILETLAVLRAEGQVPIQDVMHAESHLFPRGTTVIIVTPTTQDAWATAAQQLTRRGLRVVTVLINPESFGGTRSSLPLMGLLQASNTGAYLVENGDDITAVLSQGHIQSGYYTVA